jgi:hypothetical protein
MSFDLTPVHSREDVIDLFEVFLRDRRHHLPGLGEFQDS